MYMQNWKTHEIGAFWPRYCIQTEAHVVACKTMKLVKQNMTFNTPTEHGWVAMVTHSTVASQLCVECACMCAMVIKSLFRQLLTCFHRLIAVYLMRYLIRAKGWLFTNLKITKNKNNFILN